METIITHPLFATFAGWLAWNVWHLSMDKKPYDDQKKCYSLKKYFQYSWDNWLRSLVFVPVLLFIGAVGLDLSPLVDTSEDAQWSDLYYLGAGFIPEWLWIRYKKWKENN